jgi:hypothetical protein
MMGIIGRKGGVFKLPPRARRLPPDSVRFWIFSPFPAIMAKTIEKDQQP